MAEPKEFTGWAVFTAEGILLPWTVREEKFRSEHVYLESNRSSMTWHEICQADGISCERIVVRPLAKGE